MPDDKHLMAVRLDQDDYDWLKALAEATTGGNASLALRKIVKAAREATHTPVSHVSHVIQTEETKKATPKPKSEPMPDPSNKLAYQRWLRNSR